MRTLLYRKPYMLISIFHFVCGFLLLASGITWIVLCYVFWPPTVNDKPDIITRPLSPGWEGLFWIFFTGQGWSGLIIVFTALLGFSISDTGRLERFYIAMLMFCALFAAPAAIITAVELLFNVIQTDAETQDLLNYSFLYGQKREMREVFTSLSLDNHHYAWILLFPIVGMSVGTIELVLAFVTLFQFCCCRPTRVYAF